MQRADVARNLDMQLSSMSRLTNIDFAKFDLDEPLPASLTTNGHQSSLAKWIGKTPRQVALSRKLPPKQASTSPARPIMWRG